MTSSGVPVPMQSLYKLVYSLGIKGDSRTMCPNTSQNTTLIISGPHPMLSWASSLRAEDKSWSLSSRNQGVEPFLTGSSAQCERPAGLLGLRVEGFKAHGLGVRESAAL